MSTHPVEKLVVRESGWAKARHQRGKGVRTSLPALTNRDTDRTAASEADSNIVRGDD